MCSHHGFLILLRNCAVKEALRSFQEHQANTNLNIADFIPHALPTNVPMCRTTAHPTSCLTPEDEPRHRSADCRTGIQCWLNMSSRGDTTSGVPSFHTQGQQYPMHGVKVCNIYTNTHPMLLKTPQCSFTSYFMQEVGLLPAWGSRIRNEKTLFDLHNYKRLMFTLFNCNCSCKN